MCKTGICGLRTPWRCPGGGIGYRFHRRRRAPRHQTLPEHPQRQSAIAVLVPAASTADALAGQLHRAPGRREARLAHMLRHSCGYYLADYGTDLRTMQDYLGHRDPKRTAHFTRAAPRSTASRGSGDSLKARGTGSRWGKFETTIGDATTHEPLKRKKAEAVLLRPSRSAPDRLPDLRSGTRD